MGLGSAVCVRDLRIARPNLTYRPASITNNEWHSGTRCPMLWCVPIACNAIYSFISTFLVFPYTFLDSSLRLWFGLVYIPSFPFCYAGSALSFTHRYHPHVFHTTRVLFLQPISSCLFLRRHHFNVFLVFVHESRLSPQSQTCDLKN